MSEARYITYPKELRAKQKAEGCSLFCIGVVTPKHEISSVGPCTDAEAKEIVEFLTAMHKKHNKKSKP